MKRMRTFHQFADGVEQDPHLEGVITLRRGRRAPGMSASPIEEVDAFVASHGYSGLGQKWIPLSNDEAGKYLEECLRTSLAYSVEMLSEEETESVTSEFMSFFECGASRWFTNGSRTGWNPITKSTFEAALGVVDEEHVGLFVIEDED